MSLPGGARLRAAPPAILSLGFRTMYLLAGAFAAISIPLWVAQYAGMIAPDSAYAGSLWHAHEMIFGFALAVIVGFLFTAGRNWSGEPTPTGLALAAIAALWFAARVLALTPWRGLAGAFDDCECLPAAQGEIADRRLVASIQLGEADGGRASEVQQNLARRPARTRKLHLEMRRLAQRFRAGLRALRPAARRGSHR